MSKIELFSNTNYSIKQRKTDAANLLNESLKYDIALAKKLFPSCVDHLDSNIIATLLASTRIVGMKIPGEHSIYSSIECDFTTRKSNILNNYDTKLEFYYKKHEILQTYLIYITSPFICNIKAFIRPQLLQNKSLEELHKLYPNLIQSKCFEEQRALVIGASSGIGNSCAKLLMLGGAEVMACFNQNQLDINKKILEKFIKNPKFLALQYNVLKPQKKALKAIKDFNPTHIYYFATPKIKPYQSSYLNKKALIEFIDYYIFGLQKILQITNAKAVFSPSSIFVDEKPKEFKEYIIAKIAFESYIKDLEMQTYTPRLPKLQTNQTLQITKDDLPPPHTIIINLLYRIKKD